MPQRQWNRYKKFNIINSYYFERKIFFSEFKAPSLSWYIHSGNLTPSNLILKHKKNILQRNSLPATCRKQGKNMIVLRENTCRFSLNSIPEGIHCYPLWKTIRELTRTVFLLSVLWGTWCRIKSQLSSEDPGIFPSILRREVLSSKYVTSHKGSFSIPGWNLPKKGILFRDQQCQFVKEVGLSREQLKGC